MKFLFVFFFQIPVLAYAQPNHIVISQVYGGGGNSGAVFSNDFIEIFNPGTQAIDLSGYSLQYSSAAGSTWNSLILLSGIIPAKKYFLVQLAGGLNGGFLPSPDLTSAINLSATSGKVALVNSINPLSGTCPVTSLIVDFLGYGTASCSEGQPAGQGSSTVALIRKAGGCTDTDQNSLDFISGPPSPKNSASPPGDCSQMNSNLPIYFSKENGYLKNGKLEISWTNNAESEVDFYLIDASENGNEFVPVQKIFPEKNDGSRANYSIGIPALPGFFFFRIKGREWNGTFTYSKIIKVSQSAIRESIRLFPNPAVRRLLRTEQPGRTAIPLTLLLCAVLMFLLSTAAAPFIYTLFWSVIPDRERLDICFPRSTPFPTPSASSLPFHALPNGIVARSIKKALVFFS